MYSLLGVKIEKRKHSYKIKHLNWEVRKSGNTYVSLYLNKNKCIYLSCFVYRQDLEITFYRAGQGPNCSYLYNFFPTKRNQKSLGEKSISMCFAEMNKVILGDFYMPESRDIFEGQWVMPKGHRSPLKRLPPTEAKGI